MLVTRIVVARMRVDPVRVAVAATDALPGRIRRRAARAAGRSAVQRLLPSTSLLLLDRAGRRRDAEALARTASVRLRGRRGRRLATLVVALERAELAEALPERGSEGTVDAAVRLRDAQRAMQAGRMSEAVELLRPFARRNGTVRRRFQQYAGELASLRDGASARGVKTPVTPIPGRVLHMVTNALPYTQAGYTVRTHRIVTAQRAAGLDPHVVTSWGWPMLQGHFAAAKYEEVDGIPYHRLLPSGPIPSESHGRMVRGVEEATRLAERLRPSVLHAATDHRNGSVALAVGERTGLPVVYEVRGFLEETWLSRAGEAAEGSERHLLQREREAHIMRTADAVVTLAATMREEIVARGVPAERVFLAPNAVDASLLTAEYDGKGFRESLNVGAQELVVGSVSSIVAYEGFATLLDAAALLRDRGLPVRVLIVGDGAERPALLERVKALGLEDLALLPGRVSPAEALRAQAAIDVFVTPRIDARVCRLVTPLKPVEAMALGKPVVASDLPALAELVGPEAGLLVRPEDPESLADALAELRDDPRRRAEMGAAGREAVAAHRTWDRVAETYVKVYAAVTD
ncbi:glycosyltransferase family 4 protein [Bailinhaonella thermotolerans]|uniref:glycosyltransferase family 4 protein n=1 Tax=Bailinhaonella thermotolerans TaxID=1070861 RepID=UPI001F5B5145|nr:glycosyltransferase family 4 protein [Bailinhaonella thermotolerans]